MFTYWLCYLHCYQINIGCKQFLDYCIVYCYYVFIIYTVSHKVSSQASHIHMFHYHKL